VQLLWGAPYRDWDSWVRRLKERDARIEGLCGEGLNRDARVVASSEEGMVNWGGATEAVVSPAR